MNRYDEVTGQPLLTESPKKDFGVPLPGDPSLAYTLEKNKLAEIYGRFSSSVQMLGEHPEARELIESRGLGQLHATGRFQPPGADAVESQRRAMMGDANSGSSARYGDAANSAVGGSPQQPEAIHSAQGAPLAVGQTDGADQLANQMASLGRADAVNVFSTQKFGAEEA